MDPMIKESLLCIEEGVVEDADLLDGAMIFATGFAPFRGGPLHSHHHSAHKKHASKEAHKGHKVSPKVKVRS